MAVKRDLSIYGFDETAYADVVSSKALDPSAGMDSPDYWGSEQDDRAQAKANVGAESLGPTSPDTPVVNGRSGNSANKGRGDVEKLMHPYPQLQKFPRHTPGTKTSKDEGGAMTTPPPRNQTSTKKGGSPKP